MPSAAGGCEFIDIYVFIRYFSPSCCLCFSAGMANKVWQKMKCALKSSLSGISLDVSE